MNISNTKFRKILNDLKRRPEDAAKELKISKKKILFFLKKKNINNFDIIKKAIKIWPVNYGDFFSFEDDTKNDFKIMRSKHSDNSSRIMTRGGNPYYLYKDTVTSKLSPFKPELITELQIVNNNNANNSSVKFNNGHFLHQFTYFIGPVNFYYILNGKKKIAIMNTGDSMYISPYVPHSFTTRKNNQGELGKILAITYSDKLDNETLNESSSIGFNLVKKYKINLNNEYDSFWSNLQKFINNSSITINILEKEIKYKLKKDKSQKKIPQMATIKKIAKYLNLNLRDLLPPHNPTNVKIQKYKDNRSWFYPSDHKKDYKIVELTNVTELPYSKGFEIKILKDDNKNSILEVPTHQYIYNIGSKNINVDLDGVLEKLNVNDSMYIKPNKNHRFINKGKILVLRLGGRLSGDSLYQLSKMSEESLKKTLNDNKPWFNK
jgi:hypothetical protein